MFALNSGHTISDVGDPDLIGPDNGKLSLYAIRGNHRRSAGDTPWCFIAPHGFNPVQLHNTTHPVFAAGFPDFVQIAMNPPVTVYASAQ